MLASAWTAVSILSIAWERTGVDNANHNDFFGATRIGTDDGDEVTSPALICTAASGTANGATRWTVTSAPTENIGGNDVADDEEDADEDDQEVSVAAWVITPAETAEATSPVVSAGKDAEDEGDAAVADAPSSASSSLMPVAVS